MLNWTLRHPIRKYLSVVVEAAGDWVVYNTTTFYRYALRVKEYIKYEINKQKYYAITQVRQNSYTSLRY